MRIFKFILCFLFTVGLVYALDNRWVVGGNAVPPLGKFLDPYQGFWQNIESQEYRPEGNLEIPGLTDEVTVIYDSLLIPHIFAQNETDLYLAQGYVTASHRLWQMEFQTHAAAGRVSEIIGDAALDYDRKQRRLGMTFGAEHAIEQMVKDPEVNRALTAYTTGVNAYIETLEYHDLPFEYKLLNYKPEPWTVLKAGLLLKNLSQTLNISEKDLEFTNALQLFGKEMVDLFYFESDRPIGDPIVDNPGGWKFNPITLDSVPLALPQELIAIETPKESKKGIGSNNWAVHGSKTVSGAPILCNDPHLTLSLPSIWYVVHLNAPGINTLGASLPGTPMVILGYNDSIAWGCTNAQRDLADWYKIQFKDHQRNEYLSDGKWKPTTKKIEKFLIRDKTAFYDTVVYTHHGPVVYDTLFYGNHEKNHYAFRWIAHDGSEELKTFYKLNRGKNYNDYVDALKYWSGPAQNFAFASSAGDIAIRVQGKFPVRRKGEGKFILDGTTTDTEWKAFIPYEQQIFSHNPSRGFISSANQYPADATYPYYIQSDWYETFRNRRINEVLSQKELIRPEDMMALQNDNYNLQAAESLPMLLPLVDSATLRGEEKRIWEALGYWDFYSGPESVEASYYEVWWNTLQLLIWDEMVDQPVSLEMPDDYATIQLMKNKPDFSFYDIRSTPEKEDLQKLVRMSFSSTVKTIEQWEKEKDQTANWADYKDTYIQHLLRIEPISKHVRIGGNRGIVNAANHRAGPSWRMVVSLEKDGAKGWGVYPAGQSGNPGSKFYDNMVEAWSNGKYFRMLLFNTPNQFKSSAYTTTKLNPAAK